MKFLWLLISGRILDDEDSGQKDDFSIHKVSLAYTVKPVLSGHSRIEKTKIL